MVLEDVVEVSVVILIHHICLFVLSCLLFVWILLVSISALYLVMFSGCLFIVAVRFCLYSFTLIVFAVFIPMFCSLDKPH